VREDASNRRRGLRPDRRQRFDRKNHGDIAIANGSTGHRQRLHGETHLAIAGSRRAYNNQLLEFALVNRFMNAHMRSTAP
jgi:hypothetical protein